MPIIWGSWDFSMKTSVVPFVTDKMWGPVYFFSISEGIFWPFTSKSLPQHFTFVLDNSEQFKRPENISDFLELSESCTGIVIPWMFQDPINHSTGASMKQIRDKSKITYCRIWFLKILKCGLNIIVSSRRVYLETSRTKLIRTWVL